MYIKQIVSIDTISGEADVVVSDGLYELLCYNYQSAKFALNMDVDELSILFSEHIMKSSNPQFFINKLSGYYAYHLQGKVIDVNEPTIIIGDLTINLDKMLPNDIVEGDFVEFIAQRIDCFMKKV